MNLFKRQYKRKWSINEKEVLRKDKRRYTLIFKFGILSKQALERLNLSMN